MIDLGVGSAAAGASFYLLLAIVSRMAGPAAQHRVDSLLCRIHSLAWRARLLFR